MTTDTELIAWARECGDRSLLAAVMLLTKKVECTADRNSCWRWTGRLSRVNQRPRANYKGRATLGTHLVYRTVYGLWPGDAELHVCHSCDNPSCLNPDHLWLGTQSDNMRDAAAKGRMYGQQRTHCPNGHPYSDENTYNRRGHQRTCRKCHNERTGKFKKRLRAERGPPPKRTHCPHGHEYTTSNTMINIHGARVCRECNRIKSKQWREKAAALAAIRAEREKVNG